jgi:hypothetical protein
VDLHELHCNLRIRTKRPLRRLTGSVTRPQEAIARRGAVAKASLYDALFDTLLHAGGDRAPKVVHMPLSNVANFHVEQALRPAPT